MTDQQSKSPQFGELRFQAEARLGSSAERLSDMSPEEVAELVHELQTRQIELEMQNEELRTTQEELAESRDSYSDLYDLFTVGYLTVSEKGLILEANLAIADLLGKERRSVIKERFSAFIVSDDQDAYYRYRRNLLESRERQSCEVRMRREGSDPFWGRLDGAVVDTTEDKEIWLRLAITDITVRKQVEDSLLESEKRFMDVLRTSGDAILLIDGETFVDCNEATARMLGYSNREEFLMTHPSELSPPMQPDGMNSFEKANVMIRTAFEKGFHRFEWTHRKADGEDFPVEVSLTPIPYQGRTILHCLWRDLTDHNRAKEQLLRSETKFRTLYDSTSDAVMLLDEKGFFDCNDATMRIFGCKDKAEFCAKHPADLSPAEQPCGTSSMTLANRRIATAMENGSNQFEWIHKRLDTGEDFPAEVLLNALELAGRPVLQAVVRDITERKRAEEALRESEERFRRFAVASGYGFAMGELSGRLIFANAATLRIVEEESEEAFTDKTFYQYYIPEDAERLKQQILPIVLEKGRWVGEVPLLSARGNLIPTEQNIFLIRDEQGTPRMVGNIITDITERKQSEVELEETRDKAEAANRARASFWPT